MTHKTSAMNIRIAQLREYVNRAIIELHYIPTGENPADMFTKPLNGEMFAKHRNVVMRGLASVQDEVLEGLAVAVEELFD